jgi:hypothetical protein
MLSMNYPTNRVHVYPVIKEAKKQELLVTIMQDTLHSSEYNKDLGRRHPNPCKHNKNTNLQHRKQKGPILLIAEKKQRESHKTL